MVPAGANAGHAAAKNELARLHETGRGGVPRDLATARRLYAEAAEAHLDAQTNYAAMLFNGKGGPADRTHALRWLERAAANGNPLALHNLGKIHLEGMAGVEQNLERGLHLLQQTAASGDKTALHRLGLIHLSGQHGQPADPELAAAYLREAALRDHGQAQLDLAELYQTGRGVLRDPVQSYVYASLAAHNKECHRKAVHESQPAECENSRGS
jgi:TPR repeat protein